MTIQSPQLGVISVEGGSNSSGTSLTQQQIHDEIIRICNDPKARAMVDDPSLYCDIPKNNTEMAGDTLSFMLVLAALATAGGAMVRRRKGKITKKSIPKEQDSLPPITDPAFLTTTRTMMDDSGFPDTIPEPHTDDPSSVESASSTPSVLDRITIVVEGVKERMTKRFDNSKRQIQKRMEEGGKKIEGSIAQGDTLMREGLKKGSDSLSDWYRQVLDGVQKGWENISEEKSASWKLKFRESFVGRYINSSRYTLTPEDNLEIKKSQEFADGFLSGIDLTILTEIPTPLKNACQLSCKIVKGDRLYSMYNITGGEPFSTIVCKKDTDICDDSIQIGSALRKMYISRQSGLKNTQKLRIFEAIDFETLQLLLKKIPSVAHSVRNNSNTSIEPRNIDTTPPPSSMVANLPDTTQNNSEKLEKPEENPETSQEKVHISDIPTANTEEFITNYATYQVDPSSLNKTIDYILYAYNIIRRYATLNPVPKAQVMIDIDILPGYHLSIIDGSKFRIYDSKGHAEANPNDGNTLFLDWEMGEQLMRLHQKNSSHKNITKT